ncbi:class I SAM-dependent methyltransferase [Bacteroidota bacterium]
MGTRREWFGEWFDSRYYHVLYKHRDFEEARQFIDILTEYLKPGKNDQILDLACGKGRYSIYLNQKGYQVTGIDLSKESLEEARKAENDRLHFHIHDMRMEFCACCFDYIFNMFTSFGYFETKEENAQVVIAAAKALKSGGKMLIDFLNPYTVVHNLIPEEEKQIDGIKFYITKTFSSDEYILKDIEIEDNGRQYHFQERVKAIRRLEFMEYFTRAGLKQLKIFGDYQLNEYMPEKSERMIFLLEK